MHISQVGMTGNQEAAVSHAVDMLALLNLRFYVHQHLPRTAAKSNAIQSTDRTILDAVL